MADPAVALGIQPYNAQQGLGNLSSILGLKQQQVQLQQQQQTLQTGQYQQQTAQAESSQAQQKNAELKALAQYTQAASKDPSYQMSDGTPNIAKYQQGAMAVSPVYGEPYIGQMTSNFKEATLSRQALQSLSQDQNTQLGNALKALASNPNATRSDLNDLVAQERANNKDPGFNRAIDNMLVSFDKNDIPGSAAKASAVLAGYSQQQPSSVATGGGTLTGATNQFTGRFTPATGITQTPSPTTTTNAAGQIVQTGGGGVGSVTQIGGAAGAPRRAGSSGGGGVNVLGGAGNLGANPTSTQVQGANVRATGVAGSDIDRANQVADLQQQSSAAIPLTERIDQLSRDINSGKVAKMISESGNYLGFSSINEARSQLNKDLGQVKGIAIQKSGSDSRAGTVLEGYPTDTTPENTIHAAMDYVRGAARQNLARGQLLSQYQKSDPQGLKGFQAADNVLTATTNPLTHEYLSLPKNQQLAFLKRNASTAEEAQAIRDQALAAQRHTSVLQ